jgi:ABC-type nitrate/sulfonate/bicarbonate transport system permease component
MRLGLGYALIVVIAVEMVSAQVGLGALLWLSWGLLKVEDMYAALLAIALLGAGLSWALSRVRNRLLPWLPDVAGA